MTTSKTVITVAYDGPAIDDTMDVRELAPALLKIGELLEAANHVLNGKSANVNVLVKGDFRSGSFEVVLQIVQSGLDAAKALLDLNRAVISAQELVIALGFAYSQGALGLLSALKFVRNRPIRDRTTLENGSIQITVEGDRNNILIVHPHVPELMEDTRTRAALDGTLKPLDDPGIERFVVRQDGRDVETVDRSERPYLAAPAMMQPVEDEVFEFTARYQIETVQLSGGRKWWLRDGESHMTAWLHDEEFQRRIDAREVSFTSGDVLLVRMRRVQSMIGGVPRGEHRILKVYEHIPVDKTVQANLFPRGGGDGDKDETEKPSS